MRLLPSAWIWQSASCGDAYLRSLLVQGARSALQAARRASPHDEHASPRGSSPPMHASAIHFGRTRPRHETKLRPLRAKLRRRSDRRCAHLATCWPHHEAAERPHHEAAERMRAQRAVPGLARADISLPNTAGYRFAVCTFVTAALAFPGKSMQPC